MYYIAHIEVLFKKSVLEPQGQAVLLALKEKYASTSQKNISESISKVRVGKVIEVSIEAPSMEEAETMVNKVTKDFLYNPVMEVASVKIREKQ